MIRPTCLSLRCGDETSLADVDGFRFRNPSYGVSDDRSASHSAINLPLSEG